jgi:hypothetical protein
MQTATNPRPTRQRGDRVRGYVIRDFALLQHRARPTPAVYLKLIEVATYWIDNAHHDAQPAIQWHAQDTTYARPPLAMQALAKVIAETFGCIWFEEGSPRWYHYGGSSRLRAWAAMFVFEKTWTACDRFAHYELLKNENPDHGARRTFVSNTRDEWVARLCEDLPEREIESWVVQEWKLARSKARARGHKHNRQPPRSMSYEDVARWLGDVIESWHV